MNNIRYTINPDGTIERWYLEKELPNNETALRKTPTPKCRCCMTIFQSEEVFSSARDAKMRIREGGRSK